MIKFAEYPQRQCRRPVTEDGLIEKWLPVAGYKGLYEVSDRGRVKSLIYYRGTPERILRPTTDSGGYRSVHLWKDKKSTTVRVHELVARAFLESQPEGTEVCHGPAGGRDDSAANLSWGSRAKNQGPDRRRDGTSNAGSRNGRAKLTDDLVLEIRKRLAAWESQRAIALAVGVSQPTVSSIANGHTWKTDEASRVSAA